MSSSNTKRLMEDQKKQQLKRERASLENEIDQKLLSLGRLDLSTDIESGFRTIQGDIDALLGALGNINDQIVAMEATMVEKQQNEHHREILQGYHNDFKKTKQKMKSKYEKHELLNNCRKDIQEFKESHGAQMLGRERDALSKVSSMANQIMATAQSSRQRLSEQRGVFGGIMEKSGTLIKKLPMVNDVIEKIQKKRNRDMIVLSFVIGLCLFLTWLYLK
uniref:Golgi SNAP receptor complex member 1 n=1 Tax=Eutreptiella gymnastica TaxID=73025 RepID=A0A7S1N1G8_9EUGL|mmetsp:Transcript_105397/g.181761  ORF Transcript_105397/g.181761 Transcript_105397/m.181761 type:complete len:220 (+) Transcript_105397:43-702(+)